jgi:deoxyuridine 5'-triphosphate nucleotidohydrolase
MILTKLDKPLSKQSHQIVEVECDFKISEKCRNIYYSEYRNYLLHYNNNEQKTLCIFCSRKLKYTGRKNPNKKYDIDDNFFNVIDTEYKAYILGIIASDGHVSKKGSIIIKLHQKDIDVLEKIVSIIKIPIKTERYNIKSITINSSQISNDICKLLKIIPGKKSHTLGFPELPQNLIRHYIRGLFDGDGSCSSTKNKKNFPVVTFTSSSKENIDGVQKLMNGSLSVDKRICYKIDLSGNKALDFLGKLYENATIYMNRKRDLYYMWSTWVPGLQGSYSREKFGTFKYVKTRKDAVSPSKTNITDSGYDITILELIKTVGEVEFYSTGLKISPVFGYYGEIVPRSSISKTGYMLANSIGIIDRSYIGEILVPLIKINKDMPNLQLPCKLMQYIPRTIAHHEFIEVESLEETSRGEGGFGSTGK